MRPGFRLGRILASSGHGKVRTPNNSAYRVERILRGVLLELFLVVFASALDLCKILMKLESIEGGYFDHTARNVRAMVGDSLEVCKQVSKNKSVLDRALALLQSDDMIESDAVADLVYHLLEGLDVSGNLNVVVDKRALCQMKYLVNRRAEHAKLGLSLL